MPTDEDSDALFEAVRQQAEAERQNTLAQGRAEAEQVCAAADAEIRRLEADALSRAGREIAAGRDRLIGRARMNKRNTLLHTKHELLRDVFQKARQQLLTLSGRDAYKETLSRLIAEAVEVVGPGARVLVSKSDDRLCRGMADELGIACDIQASENDPGTVIALSSDGHRRVDNSLSVRLEKLESFNRQEIAAILFASDPPGGPAG